MCAAESASVGSANVLQCLADHLPRLGTAFDNRVAPRWKREFPQVSHSVILFAFSTRDRGGRLTVGVSSRHISLHYRIGSSWSANTFLQV